MAHPEEEESPFMAVEPIKHEVERMRWLGFYEEAPRRGEARADALPGGGGGTCHADPPEAGGD